MLSENQIKRTLAQCEKVDEAYGDRSSRLTIPMKLQMERVRNGGWIEALRLVLKGDPKSIKNTPLKEKE